jgi:hypothetical protein
VSGVDQHAEAHRLRAELGWGARRIAAELHITRHAATQLLARPLPQPVAEVAEQPRRPVAEPVAPVAARVASHLDALVGQAPARPRRLVVELDDFPGLAEDLALLEETGAPAVDVVNFAVDRLATAYRTARARGLLRRGQAFDVTDMRLKPAAVPQVA